jgi:hypothetical protein
MHWPRCDPRARCVPGAASPASGAAASSGHLAPALVDHHFLFHGAPIPDDVLTGIVDDILLPLVTGST